MISILKWRLVREELVNLQKGKIENKRTRKLAKPFLPRISSSYRCCLQLLMFRQCRLKMTLLYRLVSERLLDLKKKIRVQND